MGGVYTCITCNRFSHAYVQGYGITIINIKSTHSSAKSSILNNKKTVVSENGYKRGYKSSVTYLI